MPNKLIPKQIIEQKILMIRGHKVMLGVDLAELYGVSVKRLNEQVKSRNLRPQVGVEGDTFRMLLQNKA